MSNKQNPYYILALVFLIFMAGSFSFCFGFLTGSMSSDKLSPKGNPYVDEMIFKNDEQKAIYQKQWFPTQSNQTIFYIEDALAYFLAANELEQGKLNLQDSQEENTKPQYSTSVFFKEFINRLNTESSNSILLKSYTHPPTLTATSLRALSQGNLPSYLSIMNNMGSDLITQDNIVHQAKVNNPFKEVDETRTKVLFYGGPIWNRYFGDKFDRSEFQSDTNFYSGQKQDMELYEKVEIEQMQNQDWSSMFLHFMGIDKVSHVTNKMYDKDFLDTVSMKSDMISKLLDNTKKSTVNTDQTVILVSDHGLDFDEIGHHGGYSKNATTSLIFGYTQNGFIQKEQKDIGQMMDRKHLATQIYSIHATSTFCMLQGIPIPSNNLGMIIPDFFINKPDIDDFVIANNYYTNFRQVEDRFLDACTEVTGGIEAADEIKQFASGLRQQYKDLTESIKNNKSQPEDLKKFVQTCVQFSIKVIDTIAIELKDPQILFMWEGLAIHLLVSALFFTSLIVLKKVTDVDLETFESTTNSFSNLIKKLKLVIMISLVVYGLFFYTLKTKTFLSFQLVLMCCITIYSLFLTSQFFFSNKGYEFIKEQEKQENHDGQHNNSIKLIDGIFFLAAVTYFTFSRTTNDIFMNSYDYNLNFIDYYTYLLLIFTAMRYNQDNKKKTIIIILQIVAIPVLLYYIGLYCVRQNPLTQRIDKAQRQYVLDSEFYSQTLPLCIYYVFFIFLIAKIYQSIESKCCMRYKCFFLYQNFVQVNCIFVFYYCLWDKVYFEQTIKIIPTISMTHMILGEIVKHIYLQRNEIHFSTNWKIFTSSMNFTLGIMYVLEANSLIQLPLFFLIIYLACNICVSLKIASLTNMFIFLFYISQHLFFASGHTELFSELHVNVLQDMNFLKGNLIPVFNGTMNTYFYLIITALLLPIFNSLTQFDFLNQNSKSVNILNYILDINIENLKKSNMEVKQIDEDGDFEIKSSDYSSLNLTKHPDYSSFSLNRSSDDQKNQILKSEQFNQISNNLETSSDNNQEKLRQQRNQEYLEQCSYTLYCVIFISPILIGFNAADIRNITKPLDPWKESFYMPNYLFQLLFLTFYFLTMTFNLIRMKSNKK